MDNTRNDELQTDKQLGNVMYVSKCTPYKM